MVTGLLLVKVIFSLNIIWQIFNFAFQVDESESMIVSETLLLDHGTNIYSLPSPDRFISAPYTPFYYLLNWPFIHLLGTSFKPGRLISWLAAVGLAFLIYRFVRTYSYTYTHSTANRWPAVLAALSWLSLGLVAFWGDAVKPDMTAVFLSLSGLYLVFSYEQSAEQSERRLYLAAGLFALAALTKQTAFAGVGVAGLWLLSNGSPSLSARLLRTSRFGVVYLGLAFGPMLLLNFLTSGGFWYHIITVHVLPWSGQNYAKFLGGLLQSYQLFGLLALAFIPLWLLEGLSGQRRPVDLRNNRGTFIVLYLGAAWFASLSTGTYGGNHNHMLELAAAGCIAVGATLVRLVSLGQMATRRQWVLVGSLVLLGWQAAGLLVGEARIKPEEVPVLGSFGPTQAVLAGLQVEFFNPDWLGLEYRAPTENQKNRLASVAAFMNNDSGPLIYSDNVGLMLATQKPLFTTDPFTQTHATRLDRWDQSQLLAKVQNRQFSLIVLRQSIVKRAPAEGTVSDIYLSPELAQAVLQNYRLACRDIAFIYVPTSRTDFKGC